MQLYVGLACLKANPDCKDFRRFGDGRGAYVHVLAWADSREAYSRRVQTTAEELDCILVELDDVELLETKMGSGDFPEEFLNMRNTAVRQPKDVVFGTFHIWHSDERN